MDDIMNKLSEVLNDPQSMKQLSQLASALGGGENNTAESAPSDSQEQPPDISAMLSSLLKSGGDSAPPANRQPDPQAPDLSKLMQIGGMISNSAANDKNIALLTALRPLLKEENQVKIDRLIKIFRIMAAYPLIRDSGLLGGDIFG